MKGCLFQIITCVLLLVIIIYYILNSPASFNNNYSSTTIKKGFRTLDTIDTRYYVLAKVYLKNKYTVTSALFGSCYCPIYLYDKRKEQIIATGEVANGSCNPYPTINVFNNDSYIEIMYQGSQVKPSATNPWKIQLIGE